MKACGDCGLVGIEESKKYCPECGSSGLGDQDSLMRKMAEEHPEMGISVAPEATRLQRISAFFIDALIMFFISALGLILIPGVRILFVALGAFYALFRDYKGASVGKLIFGLRVVDVSGMKANKGQLIKRNLIFLLSALLAVFPLLGFIADLIIDVIVYFLELAALLATGKRFSDRFAKTKVVKKV